MKKLIKVFITMIIVLGCAACSWNITMNKKDDNSSQTNKQEKVKENKDLPYTYSSYFAKIDISVPVSNDIGTAGAKLYTMKNETWAAITTIEEVENEEQVFDTAMTSFSKGISNIVTIKNYDISNSKQVTINEFNMTNFEGTLHCTSYSGDYDLPVYGYTFYYNGHACGVIGFAGSYEVKNPDKEAVNYIKNIIDDMAASVQPSK